MPSLLIRRSATLHPRDLPGERVGRQRVGPRHTPTRCHFNCPRGRLPRCPRLRPQHSAVSGTAVSILDAAASLIVGLVFFSGLSCRTRSGAAGCCCLPCGGSRRLGACILRQRFLLGAVSGFSIGTTARQRATGRPSPAGASIAPSQSATVIRAAINCSSFPGSVALATCCCGSSLGSDVRV